MRSSIIFIAALFCACTTLAQDIDSSSSTEEPCVEGFDGRVCYDPLNPTHQADYIEPETSTPNNPAQIGTTPFDHAENDETSEEDDDFPITNTEEIIPEQTEPSQVAHDHEINDDEETTQTTTTTETPNPTTTGSTSQPPTIQSSASTTTRTTSAMPRSVISISETSTHNGMEDSKTKMENELGHAHVTGFAHSTTAAVITAPSSTSFPFSGAAGRRVEVGVVFGCGLLGVEGGLYVWA